MMNWLPVFAMTLLGFSGVLVNRGLPGVISSIQVLFLALVLGFVAAGEMTGRAVAAESDGFFVFIAIAVQVVVGLSLSIRLYYLRRSVRMDELRRLKR